MTIPWDEVDALIRRDPGGRGVCSFADDAGPLGAGELRHAAESLALHAQSVAIVTGFCIVDADPPAAETDGPPGALFLARALRELGCRVTLITDRYGLPLLDVGRRLWRLEDIELLEFPFDVPELDYPARATNDVAADSPTARWCDEFWKHGAGRELTHLVAIERCGPSHTRQSLERASESPEAIAQFEREVPAESRNACHNMRGANITPHTAKTHHLFETRPASRDRPVVTLGIGDGGNEIGMGKYAWSRLTKAIARGPAPRVATRIATDHAIVAGISNWGAYALALTVAKRRGQSRPADEWACERQAELIRAMVDQAGAVDGVAKQRRPGVDGLELADYLTTLESLVDILR